MQMVPLFVANHNKCSFVFDCCFVFIIICRLPWLWESHLLERRHYRESLGNAPSWSLYHFPLFSLLLALANLCSVPSLCWGPSTYFAELFMLFTSLKVIQKLTLLSFPAKSIRYSENLVLGKSGSDCWVNWKPISLSSIWTTSPSGWKKHNDFLSLPRLLLLPFYNVFLHDHDNPWIKCMK